MKEWLSNISSTYPSFPMVKFFIFMWYNQFDKYEFSEVSNNKTKLGNRPSYKRLNQGILWEYSRFPKYEPLANSHLIRRSKTG